MVEENSFKQNAVVCKHLFIKYVINTTHIENYVIMNVTVTLSDICINKTNKQKHHSHLRNESVSTDICHDNKTLNVLHTTLIIIRRCVAIFSEILNYSGLV